MLNYNTYTFSSIIAEDFTKYNAQKIAQILSNIIKKSKSNSPVVIGHDSNFLSNTATKWFVDILSNNGIPTLVYNTHTTTPIIKYTLETNNYPYGVIITNPTSSANTNGIKIIENTSCSKIENIAKLINKNIKIKYNQQKKYKNTQLFQTIDNQSDYTKNLLSMVSKDKKENTLRVLLGTNNMSAKDIFQTISKHIKIKKIDFSETRDLDLFAKETVKGKYNIGILLNNDSTTLTIVDDKGNIHNNNSILPVVYYYLIKYKNLTGDIVKTRDLNNLVDSISKHYNQNCHEVSNNTKDLLQKMQETNSVLAGDVSNEIYLKDYLTVPDATLISILLLDAMYKSGKSINRIMSDIKKKTGYISTIMEKSYTIEDKNSLIKQMLKKSPNFSYKPTNTIVENNLIKYVFDDNSSIIFRFINDQKLILSLEFQTEIECERNIKVVDNYISPTNE